MSSANSEANGTEGGHDGSKTNGTVRASSKSPDQRLEAFVSWFKNQPGAKLNPDVELVDRSSLGRGRGLVARRDLAADTTLFEIPRASVLSKANSRLEREAPGVLETIARSSKQAAKLDHDSVDGSVDGDAMSDIEVVDPWLELIAVLLYEWAHLDTSPWKPYLDILPETLDTLMYWDALELRELQASAILDKIGKDEAEHAFHEALIPAIKEHADQFYPKGFTHWDAEEIVQRAHRMGSIIMAYAFDLETELPDMDGLDEEDGWMPDLDGLLALGLVPMADMLNADAEFNAHLNHEEASLNMTSLRSIKAGEEIINYYGPLPNSELLRRYGYTSPKHSLYDVVEIPRHMVQKAIAEHLNSPFPTTDLEMDDSYVLERESEEPDETGVNESAAAFTQFPEELEGQVVPFLAPGLGIDLEAERDLEEEDQARLGHAFVQVMVRALTARLQQYGTSIEADQELLRAAGSFTRYRKALDVRLGEKLLLQEALDFATNAVNDVGPDLGSEAETEGSERPPAKKQKMQS